MSPATVELVSTLGLLQRLKAGLQNTLRVGLLVLAIALFLGFTVLAFSQPLRPDPYQGGEFLSLSWWVNPYERNANNRLPAIPSDLNAVYGLPDASRVWVVGTQGMAAYSTNGGGTWIQQKVEMPEGIETGDLTGVFFADAQNGWILKTYDPLADYFRYYGITLITVATFNGGDSWLPVGTGREVALNMEFSGATSDRNSSICFTSDGKTRYLRNNAASISRVPEIPQQSKEPVATNDVGRERLYAVFFTSANSGWVGGTHGAVFKTTDAGHSWQPKKTNSDQIIRALYFLPDGKRGWAAGEHGALQYTDNGGETWTAQASNTNTMLRAVTFLPDGLRGWAVGTSGVILHSEDGGKHWAHQTRETDLQVATADLSTPWHFLPPWYFFSLLLPGWIGFLALRQQAAEVVEEQTVADLFISDRPLEPGDADPMNFQAVALGLSRFLRNEKTLPPLTIAITGEWGTGKSSLMNLLRADLRRYGFQPVWFNAWHHQKEEHLLASLLQNVRLQAIPPWWRSEGFIFRARLLVIRGWRRWLPLLLILMVIAALTGYVVNQPLSLWDYLTSFSFENLPKFGGEWTDKALELAVRVGAAVTLVGTIVTTLRKGITAFGVKPGRLISSSSGKLGVSDLEAQTSFRQKFAIQFQDVTKALNPRTMIIFIDDLDRCRPENVLEVLEAVNFLVSSGDCFVVMGMARDRVERCVGLGFKDVAEEMVDDRPGAQSEASDVNKGRTKRSEFAKQYLDKLINIEVPVPAPTVDEFRQLLLPGATPVQAPLRWLSSLALSVKKLWPVLAIATFLFIGFWAGKSLQRPSSRTTWQLPSNTSAASPAAPEPFFLGGTSRAANRNGPASPPVARRDSNQLLAELIVSQRPSKMPEYWMVILIFLIVVGGGLWILTRPLDLIVKDSPGFVQALDIWHTIVAARRKTPRSLKRFTNRVRYLAMRQRTPQEGRSLLQRFDAAINRRFRRREITMPAQVTAPLIPESSLVALCVVDDFSPGLVRSDEMWGKLSGSNGSTIDNENDQELKRAIEAHMKQFGVWPTNEHRRIYLAITAGLRVN